MVNNQESESIVYRLVTQVAFLTNRSIADLPPLNDYVDPDALEELVASGQHTKSISVEFQYAGQQVTVYGDGQLSIEVRDLFDVGK